MGEPAHNGICHSGGGWDDEERCHLLSGWIRGKDTCAHWDRLKGYCQTISSREEKVLFHGDTTHWTSLCDPIGVWLAAAIRVRRAPDG
jgi:hypothetical protein